MKKVFLGLFILPLLLTGCKNVNPTESESFDTYSVEHPRKTGAIQDFNLLTPETGYVATGGFTFTWESVSNADYYSLEIASTTDFKDYDKDEVYLKESNLMTNKFDLTYTLPQKEIHYYWRVTAYNKDHKKACSENKTFFYKAADDGELEIAIEDAQDWVLHSQGSYADISIDKNNFFGNGKDSLAIVFKKEDTLNGRKDENGDYIENSRGWLVITKTEDRELYNTDAFYFNFYYSGHDSTILVRVLDYDGEYWHQQVQISNNTKQTIVMKYSDFQLRTATGSPINNHKFDWQHIRYFEIVFERTFGDGICLFSDIRAVKFDNYKNMFMDKMDFRSTDMSTWTYENFDFEKTVSEDGTELTLGYQARNAETNPNGFSGYGFQNANVYKYFVQGDALRMKVKYTGSSSNAMFYFRILEEDNDRWQFKLPFSKLIKDGYKELVLPLKAFQRVDYMNGDGAKQFYFIQKFNIGLADNYSSGTLSVKDIEVVKIDDIVENRKRVVSADGCIEDFNSYDLYTEMYYYWEQSVENKDEAMKLDTIHKAGGSNNTYCGEFDYKADMEMATYQLFMDTAAVNGEKNALQLWLRDASVRFNDTFPHLSDDEIAAEMTIQLTMDSGEWYRYVIPAVKHEWNIYTILFSEFTCINMAEDDEDRQPLSVEHIIHMAFGFKYLYYDKDGNHTPTYAIANPVYIDEIYFKNALESSIIEIDSTIQPNTDEQGNVTTTPIENMEGYSQSSEIFEWWSYVTQKDYNSMTLSTDVSSEGGSHSLKMHYKGSDSVSYDRITQFSNAVQAKGFCIDIKGDGKATMYLNLNWRSGNTVYKMRYTLTNIPTEWTHYEIGFDHFPELNGSDKTISKNTARYIESVSFGIVNSDKTESDVYVDNLMLTNLIEYDDPIVKRTIA